MEPQHSFGDICTMGGAQAFCNLKQQVVVIPCPGWHCKDVSMLNCHPVQDVIANGEGSTGVTWTGLCGFTAQHKPAIVFGEKVRALIGDRYLHPLIVRTAELGYCCLWQLVNGMHYGLPQDRLRVYVILVRADVAKMLPEDFKESSKLAFQRMEITPEHRFTLNDLAMPTGFADDVFWRSKVRAELSSDDLGLPPVLLWRRMRNNAFFFKTQSRVLKRIGCGDVPKWWALHVKMFRAAAFSWPCRISPKYAAFHSMSHVPWLMMDIIAYEELVGEKSGRPARFYNLGQPLGTHSPSHSILPAIIPNGWLYDATRKRVI